jgi:hypothetical protein
MDWDKFLNLLATILGALGAIFVMQSIATMSPELMLRQTQTHWDFSSSQIEAIASQKAENRAGIVFVLLAFILAFLTILFNLGGVRLFKSKLLALVLASFIAVIIYAALYFLGQGFSRHDKRAMGKIVTSQYLDQLISRGRLEVVDSMSLTVYAREFLDLNVPPGESTRSLMKRVATEVGKTLPPDLDYSAVEHKRWFSRYGL